MGTARSQPWAAGEAPIDALREADSEGAEELIEAMAGSEPHYHLAVNVPNVGQIANLPLGAIVETPAIVDGPACTAWRSAACPRA